MVLAGDPLIKSHTEAAGTCADSGYAKYLRNDPVFKDAGLYEKQKAVSYPGPARAYCKRGDDCWPSAADVAALTQALDPSLPRVIKWEGGNATYPAPIPGQGSQPLFGYGENGVPPVVAADAPTGACFPGAASKESRATCLAATRNNPSQWGPAFVAFPATAEHVVAAVKFAAAHNLCVSVLGTGHDFLNRHDGCADGMLIRTTLLKTIEWDLADAHGFGWKAWHTIAEQSRAEQSRAEQSRAEQSMCHSSPAASAGRTARCGWAAASPSARCRAPPPTAAASWRAGGRAPSAWRGGAWAWGTAPSTTGRDSASTTSWRPSW